MAKKILIVEDSPTTAELLSYRLQSSGYDTVSAADGEKGLEKMRQIKPDLVLLDIRMPGIDGFEVCRIAKRDPALKHIPIVFVTTASQAIDFEKGKEVGVDYHLTKPYDDKELISQIERLLAKKG